MHYKRLNFAQHCKISAFWKAGYSQKEIAEEIGVSSSTISRELKRNSRWNNVYCPDQAAASYKLRRKNSKKPLKFTTAVRDIINEKLQLDWSPEQISGYGKRHGLFKLSHERIYQYVLADKKSGGKLYLHLRCGKKKYRKRYGSPKRTHTIKNRIFIDDRPEVVNQKLRLGDWEIDTIIGKDHQDAIVTIVERLSKKTVIGRVTTKKAHEVSTEVISLLSPIKQYVLTITSDNGCEFAQHEWIAASLEASIYFAHPYHSWERGLNENTNGLIRQYIPKGSSFSNLTPGKIKEIENCLNSRPRKSLNYATPDEIFYTQQIAYKVEIVGQKIGRNDTCPCGSGKKHKKCCAATNADSSILDLAWRTIRHTEGQIVDHHLMPYVMQTFPPAIIKTAIEEFLPEDLPEEINEVHLFNQFVFPWVLFGWIAEEELGVPGFDPMQSIAMNYLNSCGNKLNPGEKSFIRAISATHYSFYSVLEVEFEKSVVVKDIFLGTEHSVKERQGTQHLKRGDVIFSRILTLDGQSIFVGMAPLIIPAKYQTSILDFKDWLIAENDNNPLTSEALRTELDLDVFDYFFETLVYLHSNPRPTLVNTDGDLILFSKSHFKLNISIENALNSLLPLTLLKKPDRFLESAKRNKAGNITEVEFPWLTKGNKKHKDWENTIMGHIIIREHKLILETNSDKRTQKGKKLLTKYLSEDIVFQQTLLETPEQKIKSAPNASLTEQSSTAPYDIPEVQEQLKIMAKKHWIAWFDSPIPALNNQIPRQAAKTKDGQARLEALLLHYEQNDAETNIKTHFFKADINYLKAELKLK